MDVKKKIILLNIILLPLILVTIGYCLTRKPDVNLIHDATFTISEFTDNSNNGNSIAQIQKTHQGGLMVNFLLKEGYAYPYAGIEIHRSDYSLFSLENYKFKIRINTNDDVRLSVRINQFLEGYTQPDEYLSYLILVKSFGLKKGENEISINTSDINEVPNWWFAENPDKINNNAGNSPERTRSIWLFSENTTPLHKHFKLDIQEFKLEYNMAPFLYRCLYILLIYYILFLLFIWKIQKVKYIFLPIEMSEIKNKVPQTQESILEFIGKNYYNPELKLSDVASHIGISEDMASDILKKYCDKSFRQYLNQVRMEDAKRLLRESDLQISEIAFKVGYNNIQHFNRVFKEYTNLTPKAFREK
jgi:AraC-like DNA-binding protein